MDGETGVTPETMRDEGWRESSRDSGYSALVGPFWMRREGEGRTHAVLTAERHANNGGIVHGGLLLGFADHALGVTVWEAIGRRRCVTVTLDMQFIGAVVPGECVVLRPQVVRMTRSLVFVRADLSVGERPVAAAIGVWKILGVAAPGGAPSGEAPEPSVK